MVAKRVPGARLIEYDGEPHVVFATQQDRLTPDLLDFLGEGDSAAHEQSEKAELA